MLKTIKNGLITENPTFMQVLGMCPTLAVTTSLVNGIGMGLSVTFVLILSNMLVSMLRKIIPQKIRIAAYVVIIATFVTIVDLVLKAYVPALSQSLGLFIPLIVVNCIILARAEAFASKNGIIKPMVNASKVGSTKIGEYFFNAFSIKTLLSNRNKYKITSGNSRLPLLFPCCINQSSIKL